VAVAAAAMIVPRLVKPQSIASASTTRPISSIDPRIADCMASAASRPCWRASDAVDCGNSAEH
jgi:hypothetical protein